MITAWMIYAILVGSLAGCSGLVLERLLRPHRFPARWVWVATMILSLAWPVYQAWRPSTTPDLPELVTPRPLPVAIMEPLAVEVAPRSFLRHLDSLVLVSWLVVSAALLLFFALLVLRARRLARGWELGEVDGQTVLFSDRWGPAVVGFLRPRVVLPAWCRSLDGGTLGLVLAHEMEHVRAWDLRLIYAAGILPIAFPWHAPLWWQLSRMKAAVEADCDHRVLRKNRGRARAYLELLLAMGRRSPSHPALATMLSEPGGILARRIRTMTMPIPRNPLARGVALASAGGLLVALACSAPSPRDSDAAATSLTEPASAASPSVDSIFAEGYQQGVQVQDWRLAIQTFRTGKGLGGSAAEQEKLNFWLAYSLFQNTRSEQEPQTLESAREALPHFQEVLTLLEASRDYARANDLEQNLEQIAAATRTYIEIQQAIIRRGR